MADTLSVWLYGEHVADILDAGLGQCAIRYTDRAMALGPAARLSLSLPVREQTYPAVHGAMRWLRGLLPEGRALQTAVEEFGIPADDVFALLSVLGRDVAGAVAIMPAGQPLVDPRARYVPISEEELAEMLRDAHARPLGLSRERGVRLSLAGLHDKLLLHRPPRSHRYYLPVHGMPSTVIVKPEPHEDEPGGYAGLASNEALCLTLAAASGLNAASCRMLTRDRRSVVIDRYDRRYDRGEVTRLHQEDMLSALGRDPWLTYERGNTRRAAAAGGFGGLAPVRSDPGPTLDDLADLLERHLGRAGLTHLVDAVTYNVAIGNADAHTRNLSLLLDRDGSIRMAPLYDLVSTRAYPELDADAAQYVNGVIDIDEISLDDIINHSRTWGLTNRVLDRVPALVRRIEQHIDVAGRRVMDLGGDEDVVASLRQLVRARVGRFLA